jgi:hypothetical protein
VLKHLTDGGMKPGTPLREKSTANDGENPAWISACSESRELNRVSINEASQVKFSLH